MPLSRLAGGAEADTIRPPTVVICSLSSSDLRKDSFDVHAFARL